MRSPRRHPRSSAETTARHVIRLAADGLAAWQRGVNLDDLLDDLPSQVPRRAIASLLFASFRQRARVDGLIQHLAPQADADLRPLLVAALTQALTQHGLPPPVAVDVAVSHARQRRGRGAAGFVNAVLRRALAAAAKQSLPPPEQLLPPLLAARWRTAFGEDATSALAALFQQEPPLTFRVRRPDLPAEEFTAIGAMPMTLPPWAGRERFFSCPHPAELLAGPWLRRGDIYIQDPATVAAPLLTAAPGHGLVLDLCAAPGGKSLLLAERLGSAAWLVAADLSPRRQRRTVANFTNARLERTAIIAADACRPPFRPQCAALVVLDVPCTNTGVFRRRPDALWRFTTQHLDDLRARQHAMLAAAAPLVQSGGSLLYSTCSLEPEENETQVADFCQHHPEFHAAPPLRLFPGPEHDGGFAVVITRQ